MPARFLRIDPFLLIIVATVALASIVPARGEGAVWAGHAAGFAIGFLFFLHGAKLSRQDILAGISALRVQVLVFLATFAMFPLLAIMMRAGLSGFVDPAILAGFVFLSIVPSTVQASIAFTAIAGGNVPAAICSAAISNLAGIFITPAFAAILLSAGSGPGMDIVNSAEKIVIQLLLPFLAGHFARPIIGSFIDRHRKIVNKVDRSTILMVVYTAFSAAVVDGLWSRLGVADLVLILVLSGLLLGSMMISMLAIGRWVGLKRENAIVLLFAGSKKSLATGVPMAGALFPAAVVGPMILPLMLFHQVQLMVCATMAAHYAKTAPGEARG